ncbi:hypothetical protein DFH06DRAFT_1132514 [Mycena polygramma]|nr:hypothetical protein DFH06DRAFT_1132514 [Mycena polygramma]
MASGQSETNVREVSHGYIASMDVPGGYLTVIEGFCCCFATATAFSGRCPDPSTWEITAFGRHVVGRVRKGRFEEKRHKYPLGWKTVYKPFQTVQMVICQGTAERADLGSLWAGSGLREPGHIFQSSQRWQLTSIFAIVLLVPVSGSSNVAQVCVPTLRFEIWFLFYPKMIIQKMNTKMRADNRLLKTMLPLGGRGAAPTVDDGPAKNYRFKQF